jgi:hypothetical protein
MEWLRDLPWQVFWFGWGMVALLAGGSLYAVWWAKRNAKAIEAQKPVDVSDLSAGYRLGWGRTVGPDLTAPLTGRPCVWWKVQVWESVREVPDPVLVLTRPNGCGVRPYPRSPTAPCSSETARLSLRSGPGARPHVIPSGWSDWRGQSLPPENRNPELRHGGVPGQGIRTDSQGTFGPRFRYVEQIIEKDAPIFVLGDATRSDPSLYGDEEDEDYVDEADDGASGEDALGGDDGDSWRPEPNRLGLLPTPDAVSPPTWRRRRGRSARPRASRFLISTEHPEAVTAEQELGAKGGMIMGGIFAALALFLAWARLAA